MNRLLIIRYLLFAICFFASFFNGSKDPTAVFIFETVIFALFFMFIKFFNLRKTDVDIPILLFFIFAIFSTTKTLYFDQSLDIILLLMSYIMFFYCVVSLYDAQFRKYFYIGFISVSVILSLVIVAQTFLQITPKATMPNPNIAAGYIAAGASFILSITVLQKSKLKLILLCSTLLLLFLIAIVLTHSRGGLFAIICGIATLLCFKFKKWGVVFFIVCLLSIFVVVPKKTLTTIAKFGGGDSYALSRPAIWKSAIEIVKEKPIFGTGPGNFELLFYKYNFPANNALSRYSKNTRFAHNEFLQIASEGGLFTLLAFLFILVVIFKRGSQASPVSIVVLSSIIGHSFVDFNLHLPATVFIAIVLSADIFRSANSGVIPTTCSGGGVINHTIQCESRDAHGINMGFSPEIKHCRNISIYAGLCLILVFNTVNFFIKPFNAEKHKIIADNFIKTNPKKALDCYQKTIKLSPNNFEYRRIIGELFYVNGDISNAIKNLKKSMDLNPKNPFAVVSLANIYYELNEFNKAEFYLLNALNIEPNYLAAKYLLAKTNEKQNKIELALKQYNEIVLIHNFFRDTHLSSGYERTLLSVDNVRNYDIHSFTCIQ